jgi:ATP-binding cassette, subfamily B, bacterial
MTFIEVASDILSVFPLKFILDKLTLPAHPDPPLPGVDFLLGIFSPLNQNMHSVTDTPSMIDIPAVIALSATLIIIFGLVKAILTWAQLNVAASLAKKLTQRLSTQVFNHLQRLPIVWHNKQEQGDLAQRATGNINDLEKFVADGMVDLVAGVLTIFGVLIAMLRTNWALTIFSALVVACLFPVIYKGTRNIKFSAKAEKKADGKLASIATEAMAKMEEIKAFSFENDMAKRFNKRANAKLEAGTRASRLQALLTPQVDLILAIGTAVIVGLGAYAAAHVNFLLGFPVGALLGTVSVGTLIVFPPLLKKFFDPIHDLSKFTILIAGATSAAERIQEVLDAKTEDFTIPGNYPGPPRFKGAITYEEVFFCYNPDKPLVLKGVNLDIPAGKKFALVGLSGSGKTTLTNLLPRFYEIPLHWGTVKIDGVDVRHYPLPILRNNISVVLQDSILFDGTIRENIKIGRPNASDAEMMEAARQACIDASILKMVDDEGNRGYDAKIKSDQMSGGQRQRIAIARAILRNAPIIIMDEPTAALDAEAEAEVMRALDGLAAGRTVLMITHRLSTVGKVDEIVVLQDGRIVEQGSLRVLKNRTNGILRGFLEKQSLEAIEAEAGESLLRTASEIRPDPRYSKANVTVEIDGRAIGMPRQLDKLVLTVGSSRGNDIQISSPFVSRLHAKLVWENNTWVIKDSESTNGLHMNGKRIDNHPLLDGERIHLAPTVALLYRQEGAVALPFSPPPPKPQRQRAQVLIEVNGQMQGMRELDKEELTIGRAHHNIAGLPEHDIAIPSRYVARKLHAKIIWENNAWVIKRHPEAENGLEYNARRIDLHPFSQGDRVYLGPEVALHYQTLP